MDTFVNNGQPSFEGLSQYRPPLCFELAGRSFELVMDSGYDYTLNFLSNSDLEWGIFGGELKKEKYECLKGDDTTYFVNVEVESASPRTGLSLVIDLDNSLVSCLVAKQGVNPKFPFLITNEVIFGAIKVEGQPLSMKRHGYTADMIGKAAEWVYSPDFKIIHIYYSERYYRVHVPAPETLSEENRASLASISDAMKSYPDPTEPALYVKIKDGMYLFSFIEEHLEKFTGPNTRGNNLAFLMNFKRMYDVGRSFGINGRKKPENYLYGAYGRLIDVPAGLLNYHSPYYV